MFDMKVMALMFVLGMLCDFKFGVVAMVQAKLVAFFN